MEIEQEKRAVRVQLIASGRKEPPRDWYEDSTGDKKQSEAEFKKARLIAGQRRLLEMMRKVGFRYAG